MAAARSQRVGGNRADAQLPLAGEGPDDRQPDRAGQSGEEIARGAVRLSLGRHVVLTALLRGGGFYGETVLAPFGKAVLQSAGGEPPPAQQLDGLHGEHAVRATAVRDHGLLSRNL